ncbi:MAG: hypothetical protein PUE72_10300 [Lachnospiraceae bacterium]|nr:hypothetical protein [Lachnospiraceae bacterium]
MKKKLVLGLAVLGTASMLCGFDNTQTAEDVLSKTQEASKDVAGMTMNMSMNLDGAINIGDGTTTSTLEAKVNGNLDIATNLDPFAMKMEGDVTVSAIGTNEQVTLKSYSVTNDEGALDTYTYSEDSSTGESGWTHTTDSSIDYKQLIEMSNSFSVSDYADWGMTFELAPEAAEVDGKECYLLTAVIDKNALNTMINKVSELSGEDLSSDEDVSNALAYLDGISLKVQYYVDTTTYLPVSLHMDLNDSDLTNLNALLAGALAAEDGSTAELVLNDASIDASCVYGDAVEITVPDEALQAAQDVENPVDSIEDAVGEIAGEAESEAASEAAIG